jgi:hypothetical protein
VSFLPVAGLGGAPLRFCGVAIRKLSDFFAVFNKTLDIFKEKNSLHPMHKKIK